MLVPRNLHTKQTQTESVPLHAATADARPQLKTYVLPVQKISRIREGSESRAKSVSGAKVLVKMPQNNNKGDNWESVPSPPPCKMHGRVWTDAELDAYVETEFGVTKEEGVRLFDELKEWALMNPEIEGKPCDDKYLLMYLR
jgi:hypothetical protein